MFFELYFIFCYLILIGLSKYTVQYHKWGMLLLAMQATLLASGRNGMALLDFSNYIKAYSDFDNSGFEPGYSSLSNLFYILGFSYNFFFLVLFFISVFVVFSVLSKLANRFHVSSFLLFVMYLSYLFFLHEFVQVRVGIAIGLLIYSFILFKDKRFCECTLLFFCACLFHYSAGIFIICFFFSSNTDKYNRYFYMYLPFLFMILYESNLFDVSFIFSWFDFLPRISLYVESQSTVFSLKYVWLLIANLVFWSLNKEKELNINVVGKIASFSLAGFFFLSSIAPVAFRVAELFEVFCLLQMAYVFKLSNKIGFILISGYVLLSLRAVFFIDPSLITLNEMWGR